MPPVRTARGTSGIPRPVVTPAYPRRLDGGVGAGADTPVGRIQPVFDGFELAESSVWGDSLDLIDPQAAYDALPASASASAATPPPPPSLGRSSQYSAAQSARRARRQTVVHTPMAWSPPSPPPQPEVQLPAVPQSVRRARRQTVVHTPMAPSPPSSPQPEVQPEVQEVVPQSIRRARRQTTLHTPLPPPLPASSLPSRPSMPGALFPATPFTPDPAPSALMRSTRARDSNVRGRTPARRRDMLPSPPAEDLPEDVPEVVSALRRSSVARTPARRREMSPPSRIIEEVSMNDTVDTTRVNGGMATEELQQKELHPKGQRTVAFLKANGKSLTRAERAQRAASYGKSAAPPSVIIRHTSMGQAETTRLRRHSHFEPMVAPVEEVQTASVAHGRDSLNTSAGSLANHHGPARMSPDASLFNLDVPPIMASAPTPHHDLSMLDEPTIPYPEHVSRSYAYVLEPPGSYPEQMVRTPRWASPELPDMTVEGAAEDWSVRTAGPAPPPRRRRPITPPSPFFQHPIRHAPSPRPARPTATTSSAVAAPASPSPEPADASNSSIIAATSMIYNWVTSLWPPTPRAPPKEEEQFEMVNVTDKPVTVHAAVRGVGAEEAKAMKKAAKKPYARPESKAAAPKRMKTKAVQPEPEPAKAAPAKRNAAPAAKALAKRTRLVPAPEPQAQPKPARKPPVPRAPKTTATTKVQPRRREPVPTRELVPARDPAPTRARPTATVRAANGSVPSYAAPTVSSQAARPTAPKAHAAPHPYRRPAAAPTTNGVAHYAQPTKAFTAAALTRVRQDAQKVDVLPARVRDHERARDLAVKRALFDRVGEPPRPRAGISFPAYPAPPRPTITVTVTGTTPGRASRARAAARAAFDADLAARAAERAALEAEHARVQHEIEAEMDRQNRRERVVRAQPLPTMYSRKL